MVHATFFNLQLLKKNKNLLIWIVFIRLKWHNILHYLSKGLHSKRLVNNGYEDKKCHMYTLNFPGQCNIVVCTVHRTFFDIGTYGYCTDTAILQN